MQRLSQRTRCAGWCLAAGVVITVCGCGLNGDGTTTFLVRIENVSEEDTLQPSDGSEQAVPLSPGVWVVHSQSAPLFDEGQADRGDGLEALAEDGDPAVGSIFTATYADALAAQGGVESASVFEIPTDGTDGAPIGAGQAFEFEIQAVPGESLTFATMFVPSNDLFFAPDEAGIALFDDAGVAISGDVTDQVLLWDVGTEVNEEPGVGPNQVQRQENANTGEDENGEVGPVDDGFDYPEVGDVISVTITVTDSGVVSGIFADLLNTIIGGYINDSVSHSFGLVP